MMHDLAKKLPFFTFKRLFFCKSCSIVVQSAQLPNQWPLFLQNEDKLSVSLPHGKETALSTWIIKRDFWIQNAFAISCIPTKNQNFIRICDIIVVFQCFFVNSDMLVTHFWCPIDYCSLDRPTSVHFANLMQQLIDQTCWKDRIII